MTRASIAAFTPGVVVLAGVAGWLAVTSPLLGIAGAIAITAVTVGICYRDRLPAAWLVTLGVCLFGYTCLGKGFAYFGAPPLYIGELVLAVGLFAALFGGGIRPAFRSPISWLIVLFGAWGLVRTIPYIPVYGFDALRDATIWGYGAFALLIAGFVLRLRLWTNLPEAYSRWFWWFAFWAPVAGVIFWVAEPSIPRVPGSGGMPVLFVKAGDFGVQLAGIATFTLAGLAEAHWRQRTHRRWLEWAWWAAWLGGVAIAGAASRGSLMAVFLSSALVVGLRRQTRLWKPIIVTLVFASLFAGADIKINTGQHRMVSADQIVENLKSVVVGESNKGNLEGTRAWRLSWWRDIINYTIYGQYRWSGKGFGINLADDDGYQGTVFNTPNRSPHNIQMTVLARAGVPGIVMWLVLHLWFAGSMLRAYFVARQAGYEWWARVDLWILAYWVAFMINAAFDVFLEGPQGGIWFWSLIGFGIAVLEAQRSIAYARQHQPARVPVAAATWEPSAAR